MSYPQLRIILPERGTACVTDSGRCEKIQNTLEAWQRLELVPYKNTRYKHCQRNFILVLKIHQEETLCGLYISFCLQVPAVFKFPS